MEASNCFRDVDLPRQPLTISYDHGACPERLISRTMAQALVSTATLHPDRKAYFFPEFQQEITFRNLHEQSSALAKGLLALDVKKGDVVINVDVVDSLWLDIMFACAAVGAVLTTPYMYEPYTMCLEGMVKKLKPKVLFLATYQSNYRNAIETVYPHAVHGQRSYCQSTYIISKDKDTFGAVLPVDEIFEKGTSISNAQLEEVRNNVDMDDPAYIVLSSGTTGEPKAVCWSHRVLSNTGYAYQIRRNPELRNFRAAIMSCLLDDVLGVIHIAGAAVLPQINYSCVMVSSQASTIENVSIYLETIRDYNCTHAEYLPFIWAGLIQTGAINKFHLPSLRGGVMGSIFITEALMQRVTALMPELINLFGAAESMCFLAGSPFKHDMKHRYQTIGTVMPHLEVKLINDTGNIVPVGEQGELCVRGWSTFTCYWNDIEKTRLAKDEEGWYHSGDIAVMDAEGFVTYIQRKAHSLRFKRLDDVTYPAVIEKPFKVHPKILDVQAIGLNEELGLGDRIVLCVIPKEGDAITMEELKNISKEQLLTRDWPDDYIFLKDFPKVGRRRKVNRDQLVEIVRKQIPLKTLDDYDEQ